MTRRCPTASLRSSASPGRTTSCTSVRAGTAGRPGRCWRGSKRCCRPSARTGPWSTATPTPRWRARLRQPSWGSAWRTWRPGCAASTAPCPRSTTACSPTTVLTCCSAPPRARQSSWPGRALPPACTWSAMSCSMPRCSSPALPASARTPCGGWDWRPRATRWPRCTGPTMSTMASASARCSGRWAGWRCRSFFPCTRARGRAWQKWAIPNHRSPTFDASTPLATSTCSCWNRTQH